MKTGIHSKAGLISDSPAGGFVCFGRGWHGIGIFHPLLARFGALLGIRCLCRHLGKHGAEAAAQGILFLVHYDVLLLACKAHAIALVIVRATG